MCANHTVSAKFYQNTFIQYIIMIILAILAGMSDILWLHKAGAVITDIFINMFKLVSMPVIALSIIVTLANYSSDNGMKMVWKRTTQYTFLTTLTAAVISCLLYLLIQPSSTTPGIQPTAVDIPMGYTDWLSSLIPSNVLTPFLHQQVMAILLLSLVSGFAIRHISDEDSKKAVTSFFMGIHSLFLVITRWIILVIPIGLFGFITTTVIQFRSGMDLHGIGEYLAVVLLANLIQGLVILPLWLRLKGIKPFQAMRLMMPALSVAFFSKSSIGTLPVTMNTIERKLHVRPETSRFVLPLCTSINMNGCAAFIFATVIYLMQNHGITITLPMMALWVFIATIAALGNAGVPMGCFFLSASLLVSMNVPILLLGVILPFYTLIDMLETSLNVWSDVCVTKVVDAHLEPL